LKRGKKARAALKKIKNIAGRQIRDIEREFTPQQKIKNRHLFLFYFFLFFICIIGFLIFSNQKLFFFMVSILPASILITNSMEYYKNNVFSFILSVLFLLLPFIYYLD